MFIKFAELHNPLFFSGKSFGTKLDPGLTSGLELEFDEEKNWLLIGFQGKKAIVPITNISSMEEGSPERKSDLNPHPIVRGMQPTAQVESPMSHVFAGPGAGKTGKSK